MKCSYCGFENPEKSKFCGKCGKTLVRNIEDIKLERLTEEERIKLGFYNRGILIAFVVLLLGLMFGLLAAWASPYDPSRDSIGILGTLMMFGSLIVIVVLDKKIKSINKKLK